MQRAGFGLGGALENAGSGTISFVKIDLDRIAMTTGLLAGACYLILIGLRIHSWERLIQRAGLIVVLMWIVFAATRLRNHWTVESAQ